MNSSRTQNFTYDELNRVKTAATQATTGTYAWGLQFGYDIWANLLSATVTQGSAPMLSATVGTNNRLTNTGFSYDADGNVLGDGINSYSFDAASQLKTAAGVTYTYDGDGKRVQKSNGKLYWYGTGSEPLAESDASGNITDEYIFFGGRRIAHRKSSGEVDYYFSDQVESARVVTNAAGTVLDDSDFYPFGGERPAITNTSGNNYKFQSKERDTETGNDDFGARYYSSSFGRMLSPDWSAIPAAVPYADLTNPQTLNLYQFVKNDPVLFIDGDGHSISTGATGSNVDPGTQTALQRGGIDGCIMDGSCPHPDLTITGNWYLTIGGSDGEQQGTNASAQSQVQVQASVIEQGKTVQGEKQPDGTSVTGVRGIIQDSITVNGKPLTGVAVEETNTSTATLNGQVVPLGNKGGSASTNNAGQLNDTVGLLAPARTATQDKPLIQLLKTQAVTVTNKNTITFTVPGGSKYSATATRTLTNVGSGGKVSSSYTLSTSQPVVRVVP